MSDTKKNSLYDLIYTRYGVMMDIVENDLVSSIGTTNIVIAKNNPRRLVLMIVNLSPNNIYVRPRRPASATSGIYIQPNGGMIGFTFEDDFVLPAIEWNGISSGSSSSVYILEGIIR